MADTKLTGLTATTSVAVTDLAYVVTDPGTTPTSNKITIDNLQKSLTVLGGASGVSTQGNILVPSDKYFYFGASDADGSFRWYISGGDLIFEKRVGGNWIERGRL